MNFSDIIACIRMPRREQIQLRLDFEFVVDCNKTGENPSLATGVLLSGLFSENPLADFECVRAGYSNDYSLLRTGRADRYDGIIDIIHIRIQGIGCRV